jgi:hypothetical protein
LILRLRKFRSLKNREFFNGGMNSGDAPHVGAAPVHVPPGASRFLQGAWREFAPLLFSGCLGGSGMTKTGKFVLFIVLTTMLLLLAKMQNETNGKSIESNGDTARRLSK